MEKEATNDFILKAKQNGLTKEQLINFLEGGYIPLPWQLKFHFAARRADLQNGPTKIGVGGARGPGKSHGVFAQITLDDCKRVDRLKCLFIRQTGIAAKESFEDLVAKVLFKSQYEYNRSSNILLFPNGSKVLLGGFRDERDLDNYVGIEYDLVAVEELTQLRFERINRLLGSLRTGKDNWRPRMYASFNPGGIGHDDVKKLFIEPYRGNKERDTLFISATYKDNSYLQQEYIDYLNSLSGNLGKAWREGDWDIFEGQFFSEWNRNRHTAIPFAIPDAWQKARGIDVSGRNGITACYWVAIDWDGNAWVYREYYATGKDADEHAKEIARLSEGEQYSYSVMDSAAWSKLGLPESIADVYIRNGVQDIIPSSKDRMARWDIMHSLLRWTDTQEPKLKIFTTCPNLIRTIPLMIHDKKKVDDLDSTLEDHGCLAGETKILLANGAEKEIKNIRIGDFVKTEKGKQKVIDCALTRKQAEIYEIKLSNGYILRGTKDHKIFTNRGRVRIDELNKGDIIKIFKKSLWRKQLDSIIGTITGMADTILLQVDTRMGEKDCIKRFGNITMEQFQTDIIFIIKTAIHQIINYPIFALLKLRSIYPNMQRKIGRNKNIGKKIYHTLKVLGLSQKNGIVRVKDMIGTNNTELIAGRIGKFIKKYVKFAEMFLKHFLKMLNGVQEVKIKIVMRRYIGQGDVYNLTVENEHNYYANGILVANCDAISYLLQTIRGNHPVKEEEKPKTAENLIKQRLERLYGRKSLSVSQNDYL